jgi:hypothetical protein
MNGFIWLLLLCCCGNNNNTCCHNHNTCIQPREHDACNLKEREMSWAPYANKKTNDDCCCEPKVYENTCCEHARS